MSKPIRFLPFLLTLVLCSCAVGVETTFVQGSGKIAGEDRPVQGIRGVALATAGDLTIAQGDQESLRVEAEDNLLPLIETQVRNGILTIRTTPNTNLRPSRPIRYQLTVKDLESLAVSSSGNIAAPELQTDRLTTAISSSGDIRLGSLFADSLKVAISSSGNLEIEEGEVGQQDVSLSSSGSYTAGDVRSKTADVSLSSSGEAELWVTERLTARLSSSGDVSYYGSPEVSEKTSSSGKVISLGDK